MGPRTGPADWVAQLETNYGKPLSPREWEVVGANRRLGKQKLVAAELDISLQTVKNHLTTIYRKLGVSSFTQAVVTLYGLDEELPKRRFALERFAAHVRAALDELDGAA
jgi:DNA-binding NarL/FixJ family response regulator